MSTTIIEKTSAFTIADADIGAGDESVTYRCTGVFDIFIPDTGITPGNTFILQSIDGFQTINATSTVNIPLYKSMAFYATHSTIAVVCAAVGVYDVMGDLKPFDIPIKSSFYASRSVDKSLGTNVWERLEFDDERYDYNNDYDPGTGLFVAPVAGVYNFSITVEYAGLNSTNDDVHIAIYVDDVTYARLVYDLYASGSHALCGATDLYLNPGQTVSVYTYVLNSSAHVNASSTQTNFSGHLVHQI